MGHAEIILNFIAETYFRCCNTAVKSCCSVPATFFYASSNKSLLKSLSLFFLRLQHNILHCKRQKMLQVTHKLKVKGCVRYIFASLFCMSLLKQENMFFISLRKHFSFLRQSDCNFSDIQVSWRHQMPKHEIRNKFYWITWEVNTVWCDEIWPLYVT